VNKLAASQRSVPICFLRDWRICDFRSGHAVEESLLISSSDQPQPSILPSAEGNKGNTGILYPGSEKHMMREK